MAQMTETCPWNSTLLREQGTAGPKAGGRHYDHPLQHPSPRPRKPECVYMRLTKEILVLYFYQETGKITLHDRFKLRLMHNGRLNKMDITITNLTIEDSGAYWCVYSAYKNTKIEKTEGEGAVLLVVNDEECDQSDASSGLGMSWYLVLVSAVTAGSVLLLSLLILFIWVIPRCFNSHSREATVVRFDGQPINETDTPVQLEMEDEDSIDVFQQQTGGLY